MSRFYDLETDLDTEAEEEFETLQSNTIETEEEYEEITEFGTYDEAAAEDKWGNMEFDKLLIEMESLVSRGKKYFLPLETSDSISIKSLSNSILPHLSSAAASS